MTDKVTRWTGSVNASEQGGFVAYGDYLATLYELKAKDAEIAALATEIARLKKQEPVQFLCDATRFKTTLLANGDVRITNMPYELAGRWVALVAAENDCHLKLAAPKALAPLTDEQIHDLSVAFRGGADWSEEDFETAELFARAIEAAHGITKGTP